MGWIYRTYNLREEESLIFEQNGRKVRLSLVEKNLKWARFLIENFGKQNGDNDSGFIDMEYRSHYSPQTFPLLDFSPNVGLHTRSNKVDVRIHKPKDIQAYIERDRSPR